MSFWIPLAILAFIVVGLILFVVQIYNGLIMLGENVEKSWSNIDVSLKQRHDEVPNLVETVKGYMNHERELLEEVTRARSHLQSSNTVPEKAEANSELSMALGRLFAVAENYPELKADQGFLDLQNRISEIEDLISDRRELYNSWVTKFNIRIKQLPDMFVANYMQLKEKEFFEVPEAEREPVKVQF